MENWDTLKQFILHEISKRDADFETAYYLNKLANSQKINAESKKEPVSDSNL